MTMMIAMMRSPKIMPSSFVVSSKAYTTNNATSVSDSETISNNNSKNNQQRRRKKKRVSFAPFVHTNTRSQDPLAFVDPNILWYTIKSLKEDVRSELLQQRKQKQQRENGNGNPSLSTISTTRGLEAILDRNFKVRQQRNRTQAMRLVLKEQARQRRLKLEDTLKISILYEQATLHCKAEARGFGLADANEINAMSV